MEKKLVQIIDYIENHMTSASRADFEVVLSKDAVLRQELVSLRSMLKGIELYGDDKLRKTLQDIEEGLEKENFFVPIAVPIAVSVIGEVQKQETKVLYLSQKYWIIAATVLGLSLMVWFFVTKPSQNDVVVPTVNRSEMLKHDTLLTILSVVSENKKNVSQKKDNTDIKKQILDNKLVYNTTFAEINYQEAPSAIFATERNADATSEQLLIDSTLILMQKKQYKNALFVLENNAFSILYVTKISAMKAHLYFLIKKYVVAMSYFNAIADNPNSMYQEESEYYLLLCYLADYRYNKNNFERLSKKIINNKEHSFCEKTKKLERGIEFK